MSAVKITLLTDVQGDGEALYIDGVQPDGVEPNHSLDLDRVIEALAKHFEADYERLEMDMESYGDWPPTRLWDIPKGMIGS